MSEQTREKIIETLKGEALNGADTCWLWTDAPTADGYGRFRDGNKKVLAHRFSWTIHFKTDIEGQELDHRCLVPLCVNPEHLRIVTRKQNNENRSGAYRNNPVGVRGVTRNRNGKPSIANRPPVPALRTPSRSR